MKRIALILAIGAALLAIAVSRAESRRPYVGLYADAAHWDCDVFFAGGFMPFRLYVWWLPGDEGLMATIYRFEIPPNVIVSTVTSNPDCMVALGCMPPDLCCTLASCHADWTWTHQIDCYLTDANPSFIRITRNPLDPALVAANCSPGYPVEEVVVLNHLALNQACAISTESSSWGAIKGIYR